MPTGPPRKTVDKFHVGFPGWRFFVNVVPRHRWEDSVLSVPIGWVWPTGSFCLVSPGLLPFSVADFQWYLSIEMNHTFEYNSFSGP